MSKITENSSVLYKDQVKGLLLNDIKAVEEKSKRFPTVRKLAADLGVSVGTIQIALQELASEGILYSHVGRGTFLLAKKKKIITNQFGLFIPNLTNYVFSEFVSEIENVAAKDGYAISLCVHGYNPVKESKAFSLMHKKMVDGIIGLSVTEELIKEIVRTDIPFVGVSVQLKPLYKEKINTVSPNIHKASSILTSHLVSLGHRRIAISGVRISRDDKNIKGYKEALETAGIPFRKELIIEDDVPLEPTYPKWYEERGRMILKRILSLREKPTALIASNDARAIGVLYEADKKGIKIPEELSLVGFDNIHIGKVIKPSLTTIESGYKDMAKYSLQILKEEIHGKRKRKKKHITIEPELIIRKSSAPL